MTALNAAGLVLGAAGLIGAVTGAPAPVPYLLLGFAVPAVYLAGVAGVAAVFARDTPAGVRARVPVALAAMHTCWGAGYLTSPRRAPARARAGLTLGGAHGDRRADALVGQRRQRPRARG